MKITVSVDNNKKIITLPYAPAEGTEIGYGESSAQNFDSTKYGQVKALGAELVLTPPELSIGGSVDKAIEIASKSDEYFVPQQFVFSETTAATKSRCAL